MQSSRSLSRWIQRGSISGVLSDLPIGIVRQEMPARKSAVISRMSQV